MIEDPDLLLFLQTEEARATDTTLNEERQTALEFYRGDLFGDEVEGRSKLRTRDVAEVVDYMCVSILRTLVSSDKIVEFEPAGSMPPADQMQADPAQQKQALDSWVKRQDELAQQITERVHANFMREQDGYTILHDGIKAGLLEKSGVWKSWVERKFIDTPTVVSTAQIEADPSINVIAPIEGEYDVDEMTGEPLQIYHATVKTPKPPEFRDSAVPNDEFFVAPDARTLDTAIYLGNVSRVSLHDLMGMGYPQEDLVNLWDDQNPGQSLTDARDAGRGETEQGITRRDLGRVVTLREEYCRWVHEGVYQLVRVHRVGTTMLSVEPVPFQPYTLWSPFPMQHRLIGMSLADKVMDIQVVRSHMLRQAMDGLYIANAPRMLVNTQGMDDNTIDDLLDVAPGGLVRYSGGTEPKPLVQPFTAAPAFEAMQIMAGEKESRTGITRLNQGLDADAMNKTATGTALMQASAQQMEEYVARNAVNAICEMFEKKQRLMSAEMAPHQFRIDGQPTQVTPQEWPQDLRLGVRVGLGTGSKEKRIQSLQLLAEGQASLRELDPRLVTAEDGFGAFKKLVGELGIGIPTQFATDPSTFGPEQPPPPDPAMVAAQAKLQMEQQKMQFDQQQAQQTFALAQWQAQQDSQLAREKAEAEMTLAREGQAAEFALKREQIYMQASTNASMAQNREGGRLDA